MAGLEIIEGIYHVGDATSRIGLDCNPYMLIDGDEAVLFDPGSVLDHETVLSAILAHTALENIKYIVLHHQDPDLCSAIPLLEAAGVKATIVTSWRTMTLIQYYGMAAPFRIIEETGHQLTLSSGRVLKFLPTPYMHFPGAFVTYDETTKSLLSSDIFGAFSYNRTLYADEDYMEKMLTFHEHYMPSNDIIRPVMDMFLGFNIDRILPQHGAIIEGQGMVERHIRALRELECGTLLHVVKKKLMASGGYMMLFNEVFRRYLALFDPDEVRGLFGDMGIFTVEDDVIIDYQGSGEDNWYVMFDEIQERKSRRWITVVDPFIKRLCSIYDLTLPKAMATLVDNVEEENARLKRQNEELAATIQEVQNRLVRCPVTGMFNEMFMDSLMMKVLEGDDWRSIGSLAVISVDQLMDVKYQYGDMEHKNTLIAFAYHLKETFGEMSVFRMHGGEFAVYLPGRSKEEVLSSLDEFRVQMEDSQGFIIPLTISAGLVFSTEIELDAVTYEGALGHYKDAALSRLRYARSNGSNVVWHQSVIEYDSDQVSTVLIVDSDPTNLEVLKTFLTDKGIKVIVAKDGEEAAYLAELDRPELIISEVMLPKTDGFILRERLLAQSSTKGIDMIFLSYLKDEKAVKRALSLGITQYIKKPYMLSEVVGIVLNKVEPSIRIKE